MAEWTAYVPKLATPERVAAWIDNNLWYVAGSAAWRPIEDVLAVRDSFGRQYGTCSEAACLFRYALRQLCYKAEIVCIYGEDKARQKVGHAICVFSSPSGRGSANWEFIEHYPVSTPWQKIILSVSPVNEWLATSTEYTDEFGNKLPYVIL